jgi:hypothetical protein
MPLLRTGCHVLGELQENGNTDVEWGTVDRPKLCSENREYGDRPVCVIANLVFLLKYRV